MSDKKMYIGFYAEAYLTQALEVVADVSEEEIVKGLNEGKYLTTLDMDDDYQPQVVEFDDKGNETVIANIVSQTSGGDSRIHTFTQIKPQI